MRTRTVISPPPRPINSPGMNTGSTRGTTSSVAGLNGASGFCPDSAQCSQCMRSRRRGECERWPLRTRRSSRAGSRRRSYASGEIGATFVPQSAPGVPSSVFASNPSQSLRRMTEWSWEYEGESAAVLSIPRGLVRIDDERTIGRRRHAQDHRVRNLSLDGYFTDAQSDMSWAHKHDEEWTAFSSSNAGGEAELLFGRVTYEMMAGFWPTPQAAGCCPDVAAGMNRMKKFVFSRTLTKVGWQGTTLVKGDLVTEATRLKEAVGTRSADPRQRQHCLAAHRGSAHRPVSDCPVSCRPRSRADALRDGEGESPARVDLVAAVQEGKCRRLWLATRLSSCCSSQRVHVNPG